MIKQEIIKNILFSINIVDYIKQYINLKQIGDNFFGKCPFHFDKTPSFTVSTTKNFFYCFGCHTSGDLINFIMRFENLTFLDVIKKFSTNLDIDINLNQNNNLFKVEKKKKYEIKLNNFLLQHYKKNLNNNKESLKYLINRKINIQIINLFSLGYCNKKYLPNNLLFYKNIHYEYILKNIFFFNNRIIFPIRNIKGNVTGFGGRNLNNLTPKYLNSKESFFFKKKTLFYGLYETKLYNKIINNIIIVEGYFDVLSLFSIGLKCTLGILGTKLSLYQFKFINFITKRKIFFCFDNDFAGFNLTIQIVYLIIKLNKIFLFYKFIILPDKYDPNSTIINKGKDFFKNCIKKSYYLFEYIIIYLKKYFLKIQEKKKYINIIIYIIKNINHNICKKYLIFYFNKKKNKNDKILNILIINLLNFPLEYVYINIMYIYTNIRFLLNKNIFIKFLNYLKIYKGKINFIIFKHDYLLNDLLIFLKKKIKKKENILLLIKLLKKK